MTDRRGFHSDRAVADEAIEAAAWAGFELADWQRDFVDSAFTLGANGKPRVLKQRFLGRRLGWRAVWCDDE